MCTSFSLPEAPNSSTLKPNIYLHALSFSCLQHFNCLVHLAVDMVIYGGYRHAILGWQQQPLLLSVTWDGRG
jgi:hypothetical protein